MYENNKTGNKVRHRVFLLGLIAAGLITLRPDAAMAGGWQSIGDPPESISMQEVRRLMTADGLKNHGELLKYPYLVRLAITDTGGGTSNHSEVAVRFRWIPKKAFARAWCDRKERNRAQLGGYGDCKIPEAEGPVKPVGRACPVKYNARGFIDVTKAFTDRNMVFIHDPARSNRGNTILWAASDKLQTNMWYYVFEGLGDVRFGFGSINMRQFHVEEKEEPSGDPAPLQISPEKIPPTDEPPEEKPTVAEVRPEPHRRQIHDEEHKSVSRSVLAERMRSDGVPNPEHLLRYPYLVRLLIDKTGGGSSTYSEVLVEFSSLPKRALGKAWADRNEVSRAQMGAQGDCRKRSDAQNAMRRTHLCPIHFNGLGWRNLQQAFTSKTILFTNNPNNPNRGGTLVWAAFDKPQNDLAHKIPDSISGTSFGLGKVSVQKYRLKDAPDRIAEKPAHRRDPWKPHALTTEKVPAHRLAGVLRKQGLKAWAPLSRYRYLVMLVLRNTGGGTGRRSELGLRFGSPTRMALGRAWADDKAMGRAQIGAMNECRTGVHESLPPGWRTCPVHFNNLGWRDLSSSLSGKKEVLVINQPHNPNRANTVLLFAFDKDPGTIMVREFNKAGRYTLGTGKIHIRKLLLLQQGLGEGRHYGPHEEDEHFDDYDNDYDD